MRWTVMGAYLPVFDVELRQRCVLHFAVELLCQLPYTGRGDAAQQVIEFGPALAEEHHAVLHR